MKSLALARNPPIAGNTKEEGLLLGSLFLDLCGDNGLHPVKTWKHKEQKRARVAIRIMLKFYVTPSDEGGVSKQKLSRNYRVNYVCSKEICNYVGEQGICCF